ncbi:MAG: hypothetical protein FJX68_20010, partial [Alphaproteobacteria bacterium]|nr:hypothetical protein [Alphaproteobacteria bacterium]
MFGFGGIAVVMLCVFGGYTIAGGKMGVILHALPIEMTIIGGAAVGTFLISSGASVIKRTLKDFGKIFFGPKYKRQDYVDVLCLLDTSKNPIIDDEASPMRAWPAAQPADWVLWRGLFGLRWRVDAVSGAV